MNNTGILKKCLEELNKDNFRRDYVVGMLETLVEMQDSTVAQIGRALPEPVVGRQEKVVGSTPTSTTQDEAAILDATAKASIERIKALSKESTDK